MGKERALGVYSKRKLRQKVLIGQGGNGFRLTGGKIYIGYKEEVFYHEGGEASA